MQTFVPEGHTDALGAADYNRALSLRRANAVRDFLSTRQSLSDVSMDVRGGGEAEPVADNETESGRQRNRRVEILATP